MDMIKIHEEIFNYLQKWSEESRVSQSANPYFYMRNQRDDRFRKGYWFPGDDNNYLCISFWAGGDSLHKSPNVYFEVHKKKGVRVAIVSRDESDNKRAYFKGMINELTNNSFVYQPEIDKKGSEKWIWYKTYSKDDCEEYMKYLTLFIENDKKIIDDYVEKHKVKSEEFEDFVARFGFISSSDFDKMLAKTLTQKQEIQEASLKTSLPFSIKSINIENFQGIKHVFIENLPNNAQWIYITGENGYGKTTLLQAIALGFDNKKELEKYMDEKTRISISIAGNGVIIRSKDSTTSSGNFQKIIGYGPSRLSIQAESSENAEIKSQSNTLSLFDTEVRLKNINYELANPQFATSSPLNEKTFRDLESIIKIVTKGRIESIEIQNREAFFIEKLSNGDLLPLMPFSKLAAGFRNLINIVCDIYLRFKNIYPDRRYQDFEGIVLIDEIETHLHPILQRELSEVLIDENVFPKIQFIATTHSPIPLLGIPRNSVILKVERNNEDGVTVNRLDDDVEFYNLLPNAILTSPIFGFRDIIPTNEEGNSEFIRVEDTYEEVLKNDVQQNKIDNFLSEENYNALLGLLKK